MKITREWENKFQIGTQKNQRLGHARIGFLYKSTRFNRTLLIRYLHAFGECVWCRRKHIDSDDEFQLHIKCL